MVTLKTEQITKKDSKFVRLVVAGVLATLAFNGAMYLDIAITGVPLDIPKTLGQLAVGENTNAEVIGNAIHFLNGIGLSLLFGYVALPISKRIVRLPIVLYAVVFMIVELVLTVWFGMLPAIGAGIGGLDIALEVPIMTLFRHTVFGIVLGVLLRRRNERDDKQ